VFAVAPASVSTTAVAVVFTTSEPGPEMTPLRVRELPPETVTAPPPVLRLRALANVSPAALACSAPPRTFTAPAPRAVAFPRTRVPELTVVAYG
jgi:hypothetical protein